MDLQFASYVLGYAEPPSYLEYPVGLFRKHLAVDNNKLREDFVCSILGYVPSFGGVGHPDGYKKVITASNTSPSSPDLIVGDKGIDVPTHIDPLDCKSGPKIVFPDGKDAIYKKIDWTCLVNEWTSQGELIYVAEVKVAEIMNELEESSQKLQKKGGRVSPWVSHVCWIKAPSTKVVYKNQSLFPTIKDGSRFEKRFEDLSLLPFEDRSKSLLGNDVKMFKFQNPVEELVYG